MSDDTSSASSVLTTLVASLLMYGFCALMVVMGIGGQVGVVSAYGRGDLGGPQAIFVFLFCAFLTGVGLAYFYVRHVMAPAQEGRLARAAALHPDAPWMLDERWAGRTVVDRSSLAVSVFLWIWNAGWWGACAFIWSVNREKILAAVSSSWTDAAFGIIFLGCGLIGLACAIGMTRRWWRYGKSTLNIDTLPGYLGQHFRGSIVARLAADTPLEAEIVCERVSVVWVRAAKGSRKRELTAEPLWSHCWPLSSTACCVQRMAPCAYRSMWHCRRTSLRSRSTRMVRACAGCCTCAPTTRRPPGRGAAKRGRRSRRELRRSFSSRSTRAASCGKRVAPSAPH